jgi:L-alanine-DL-glutamate epimerase-like enolase superfamily enzyme
MRIVAVKEQTIDLAGATRNANIGFDAMTGSAIAVHTDISRRGKPLVGLAFDSIGRYGHGGLLRERFIPRLMAADPSSYADGDGGIDPHRAWDVVMKDEKPGGHGERCGAVGLIDAALWDLAAKHADEPLWSLLRRRCSSEDISLGVRDVAPKIAVYASGGHYRANNDVDGLCDDVRRAIAQGHRRFKIKIGGASLHQDLHRIEKVLAVLEAGMSLAVDGNATFDRDTAIAYLNALSPYPLAWIEEPVHPLDFDLHRDIAAHARLPLATGENLFSRDDARNLLRHAGMRTDRDFLQFDISLSYGIVEYLRILDDLDDHGWRRQSCAPHAGHLLAMQSVAGLGLGLAEVAMDTTTLFGKLTAEIPVSDGTATLPDAPGVGFEGLSVFSALFDGLLN